MVFGYFGKKGSVNTSWAGMHKELRGVGDINVNR
jgi:hypothetical protein